MGANDVLQLAAANGPLGLVIGWLLFERWAGARKQKEVDLIKSAERSRIEEKRMALDRERLECDKTIAGALAGMTGAVQTMTQLLQTMHHERH